MIEEYDDYDHYMDCNQEHEDEQADEDEEGEFIFFGIFSGFFDWLFK